MAFGEQERAARAASNDKRFDADRIEQLFGEIAWFEWVDADQGGCFRFVDYEAIAGDAGFPEGVIPRGGVDDDEASIVASDVGGLLNRIEGAFELEQQGVALGDERGVGIYKLGGHFVIGSWMDDDRVFAGGINCDECGSCRGIAVFDTRYSSGVEARFKEKVFVLTPFVIISNASDQADRATCPSRRKGLIGAFASVAHRRIAGGNGFACLGNALYAERVVDIERAYDNDARGKWHGAILGEKPEAPMQKKIELHFIERNAWLWAESEGCPFESPRSIVEMNRAQKSLIACSSISLAGYGVLAFFAAYAYYSLGHWPSPGNL